MNTTLNEEQFIERHIPVCRAPLGENGGKSKKRSCARNLWEVIKQFDLDPAEVNSHATAEELTVEARAEIAAQKAKAQDGNEN